MVRKFISELVGTMLLVFFGCGTAVAVTSYLQPILSSQAVIPYSLLVVSLAFGLILVALIAMIGKVSGCHVNPAVSIAQVIAGRMSIFDCVYYVVAQIVGGIAGAGLLAMIFGNTASLGANFFEASQMISLGAMVTAQVALIVEIILTFTFVLTVLSATKKENANSGLVIGLTLTLVHLMGMVFTGTSVNPARSIGPALLTGETAISQLWVFIVGPLVGGILAALFYRIVLDPKEETVAYVSEVEAEMIEEPIVEETKVEEVVEEPKKEPKKKTTKKTTTKKATKKSAKEK
jgi:aquaporin Z